jgi:ribosomal protein S18 acetylase RimI-like enzyme
MPECVAVTDYGLDRAAEVLTRGFADYFVKIPFSVAMLLQLSRTDSIDLAASRVLLSEGTAIGAALIARRGWTSRLAAMALLPAARGQGAGRALVDHLLVEAKARGERAMGLEVIEQNTAAVKLYEAAGFEKIRRLVGFASTERAAARKDPATGPATDAPIVEVDVRALAGVVIGSGRSDLPWQLSGETIAQLGSPTTAYRLNGAWIAVTNLATPQVVIRALVTERGEQGRGRGAALLRALIASHPGKHWEIKPIWPEELGAVFVEAGFDRTPLTQWQMTRRLA